MSENPYQAPLAHSYQPMAVGPRLRVVGDMLVVRSGDILPPFCVKTNEPVPPSAMIKRRFTYCSPLVFLGFLGGPLIFLIVAVLMQRHCQLTYGLAPTLFYRWRKRWFIKLFAALLFGASIPFAVAIESQALIITSIALTVLAVIVFLFDGAYISVKKFQFEEFWIKGCSHEYLERMRYITLSDAPIV